MVSSESGLQEIHALTHRKVPAPGRPSPMDSPSGRQSPFRRQNSGSPATIRAATPVNAPGKASSGLSPTKNGSLLPEKTSPFVRRPSQMNNSLERPSSPFGRPASSLSIVSSPSKENLGEIRNVEVLETPPASPSRPSKVSAAIEVMEASSPRLASPAGFDGGQNVSERHAYESPKTRDSTQTTSRSVAQRTSPSLTIKPLAYTPKSHSATPKLNSVVGGGGAYTHIPQPLLHSMRESFEVLDSNNTGSVTSASVSEMLSQLGLDNAPSALKDFFPSNGPSQINLARYLDMLAAPLADLSQPNELRAAFEAFDVDDSGQIDVTMLREALLNTTPGLGEDGVRLSEREIDTVLGEFAGRRAFGAKGLNAAKTKGDVFKYRDFMANVSGGGTSGNGNEVAMAA